MHDNDEKNGLWAFFYFIILRDLGPFQPCNCVILSLALKFLIYVSDELFKFRLEFAFLAFKLHVSEILIFPTFSTDLAKFVVCKLFNILK